MRSFARARRAVASEAVGTGEASYAAPRSRIARILVFADVVLSTPSVAAAATAWFMCGT